jgi:N-acetylmuramoyl-L-alanine amidase
MGLSETPTLPNFRELATSLQQSIRNQMLGPVRVGIQIGHLYAQEQPDELAALRTSTGAAIGNVTEVGINQAVANHLKTTLEAEGIIVDLIPATVPPGYRADLFIALHADSSLDPNRRGYKSAHWRTPRNPREPILKQFIDEAYFYYTGLPDDHANVSGAMLGYYAFNHRRFHHTVHPRTPAVLVEMGYISNPQDLAFLRDPVNPAYALKRGIMAYLKDQGRIRRE